MSIIRFIIFISFILMLTGSVGIVSLIFEGDYREIHRKPKAKKISCKISEYHKSYIEGKFGFVVYTNTKDTLYLTYARVNELKRSGIWDEIKDDVTIGVSYLEKYKKNSNYIKTIEEIRHKGIVYLGLKDVIVKEKITIEEKQKNAIQSSLFILGGILIYFLTFKTRPLLVNRLPMRFPDKLVNINFPIQKGDIRISKIKEYYVIDKKVKFELQEVAKIINDNVVVNKFLKNNVIKFTNIKFIYLDFYTIRSMNDNSSKIVAEYGVYTTRGKLKRLFKVSEGVTENGIITYFKNSNYEVLLILCSIMDKNYKLNGDN